MKTYCTKSCADCNRYKDGRCNGCKDVLNKHGCEIAKCCHDSGHDDCSGCNHNGFCPTYNNRITMPKLRDERIAEERATAERNERLQSTLSKYLMPLFIISLTSSILGLLPDFAAMFALVVSLIDISLGFVRAVLLRKMSSVNTAYGSASNYRFIASLCSLIAALINLNGSMRILLLLVTIPSAVLGIMSVWNEYGGHSEVLVGIDNELSESWESIRKWYIAVILTVTFSPFLAMFGILGVLVLLAAGVISIVISVRTLICLYRTADVFRNM